MFGCTLPIIPIFFPFKLIFADEPGCNSLGRLSVFNDPNTTLTDEVVMPIFEKMISDVTTKLNCKLRDN